MSVKFVTDKCPGCPGICTDQCFRGFYEIFFRPCGIQIWDSIRPDATSKNSIRVVAPWRIYSNSIFAHCPGRGGLSGYLCSNACIPVISSVEMICPPSWLDSCAFWYMLHISFTFCVKDFGSYSFSEE